VVYILQINGTNISEIKIYIPWIYSLVNYFIGDSS
jgi:hypothetical protein